MFLYIYGIKVIQLIHSLCLLVCYKPVFVKALGTVVVD